MQITIHGTLGGHKELYPKTKETTWIDARPDSNKVATIGQQAYSIHFENNSVIFSKYRIVRDVIGSKRTGRVSFSVIIPNSQKLAGEDVLALLNRISSEFSQKHIVNDNLDKFREDWAFVDAINALYKENLQLNDDEMSSGTSDAAFVYYPYTYQDPQSGEETTFDIKDIFDAPYQEEYSEYKQVFFVEKRLEGKDENPLNALRHSSDPRANLTGKIDLDNPKYKLLFSSPTDNKVEITVKVDDNPRFNENKIRKKDELEIIYSKPYHHDKRVKNTLDKISEYVDVNEKEGTVTIKDNVVWTQITHNFTFEVIREDGKPNLISDVEIVLKDEYQQERKAENNQITLTDEDLHKDLQNRWTVVAKTKDGSLLSEPREIRVEDAKAKVKLILHKELTVVVLDQENGDAIWNFTARITKQDVVKTPDKNKNYEVEFVGAEVAGIWNIQVECKDYQSEGKVFCPADKDKDIVLKLKKLPKYCIELTEKIVIDGIEEERVGTKKAGFPSSSYSNCQKGSDVEEYIQPPKGYRFSHFDFDEKDKGNKDGTIKARYDKLSFFGRNKKWLGIGSIVGTIAILAVSILFFSSNDYKENQSPLQPQQHSAECEWIGEQIDTDEENLYKPYDDEQSDEFLTI